MKPLILFFIAILLLPVSAQGEAQQFTQALADSFADDLLKNSPYLDRWVQSGELALSRRLGINYYGLPNKFLISYDINEKTRESITGTAASAETHIHPLDGEYVKLSLTFEGRALNQDAQYLPEYYFHRTFLISPILYHTRDWHRFETEYFIFYLSDWSVFNEYSARQLDAFVEKTMQVLGISQELQAKLRQEKIYYFRCRDTEEIRKITGYPSRGMYNLAYDYIITTYNCHYHEIVHLLVNYKLQDVHLLTHPFFQEGIAVALGGRGGREQPVIMNLGMFLERSGFASYTDLLPYESFTGMDASLSYPVSGLYAEFLIRELGIGNFMRLYQEHSGSNWRIDIPESILPSRERWESFVQSYKAAQSIHPVPPDETDCISIYSDSLAEVCMGANAVRFKIKSAVLIMEARPPKNYQSPLFNELLPGVLYRGEKYLVTANENEISVYNLYTNNLTAKYIPSMSVQQSPIRVEDGYYVFSLEKTVFEEDAEELMMRTITGAGCPQQ